MSEGDQDAARARMMEVRDAYLKIFGPPGEPTPYGKVVLEDLEKFCTLWVESIHRTSDGAIDPFGTIYRDGKKAVALRIHGWLRWRDDHGDRHRSVEYPDPARSAPT